MLTIAAYDDGQRHVNAHPRPLSTPKTTTHLKTTSTPHPIPTPCPNPSSTPRPPQKTQVLAEDQATLRSAVEETSTSYAEAVKGVPVLTSQEVQQVVDTAFKPYKTMVRVCGHEGVHNSMVCVLSTHLPFLFQHPPSLFQHPPLYQHPPSFPTPTLSFPTQLENMQRSMGSQAGQLSSLLPTLAEDVQEMRTTLTDTLHTIAHEAARVMEATAAPTGGAGQGGVSVREVEAVVEQVMQPYSTMVCVGWGGGWGWGM